MGILLSKIVMFRNNLSFQSHEHVVDLQKDLQLKDRISELPDDIFMVIVSHLLLKEVARNSVVSRRWRNCWKVMTRLEFDSFDQNASERFATKKNMLSYVKWVNRLLDSHEGAKLHEFRICYGLYKHFRRDINKWIRFAFLKQVECFHLEVLIEHDIRGWKVYNLTTDFVETFMNRKCNGFKYLKALSFKRVNIDDKLFWKLIMEYECTLAIGVNLFWKYSGCIVWFEAERSISTVFRLAQNPYGFENHGKLPQLTALEKLVVQNLGTQPYTDWYARLTKTCPSLREFVFQCTGGNDDIDIANGQVSIIKDIPHKCLKKVKILGYHGCTRDVALASYFFRNTVAFETMVIDPRDQCPFFYRCAPVKGLEQDSRIRAKKQLKGKVPSRVKLVIL